MSSDIRDILKWDTLEIRRFRHKAIMVYNIQSSKAPVSLCNLFKEKENSVYKLRSNNNFQLALGKPRTEYLRNFRLLWRKDLEQPTLRGKAVQKDGDFQTKAFVC